MGHLGAPAGKRGQSAHFPKKEHTELYGAIQFWVHSGFRYNHVFNIITYSYIMVQPGSVHSFTHSSYCTIRFSICSSFWYIPVFGTFRFRNNPFEVHFSFRTIQFPVHPVFRYEKCNLPKTECTEKTELHWKLDCIKNGILPMYRKLECIENGMYRNVLKIGLYQKPDCVES